MATKKITLKDKNSNELYPKTAAQLVQVSEEENLVQYLAKIITGATPVGKATAADTAKKVSNKLKLKDSAGTVKEFDGSAGVDLSGGVYYATQAEKDSSDRKIIDTYAEREPTNNTLNAHDKRISTNTGDITQLKSDLQNLKATATSAYVPKGSVQNVSELAYLSPGTLAKGHVYNIIEAGEFNDADGTTRPFSAGANVVYIGPDGTEKDGNGIALTPDPANTLNWDLLGGIVDLSNYVTSDQLAEKQDIIDDLETIRRGAEKGLTALQSYTEKYTGTITAVKANGTSIATSGEANIPAASTSAYGVTKLSSATNSTSEVLAATPKAVKSAYDLANGKYTKPSAGIPKTDLASTVQTSLGKADTALQSHQDISGKLDKTTAEATYAKKTDVEGLIGVAGITYEYDTTGGTDEVIY